MATLVEAQRPAAARYFSSAAAARPYTSIACLKELDGLKKKLLGHPLYDSVKTIPSVQAFAQSHVFAVWDFMCLVKTLQTKVHLRPLAPFTLTHLRVVCCPDCTDCRVCPAVFSPRVLHS